MRRTLARVRGLGFILWQARHMFYHVLLGLVWAWILREIWGQFNPKWFLTSVFGSLLPDIDHVNYLFGYGKKDNYTRTIFEMLKKRQWRMLALFIATGHKYNTNLSYHNYYFMGILGALAAVASYFDWQAGFILFGAMVGHYLFDVFDDLVILGEINPNWRRWGNGRRHKVVD